MTATEIWKPIPRFNGAYEVSNLGRLRSLRHGAPRVMKLHTKQGTLPYFAATIAIGGDHRPWLIHRLVLEAFVGDPTEAGMHGCHRNGDPQDNRPENLYWGTVSENIRDTVRHGRHNHASKTHCKRSHEFTPENTHITKQRGTRLCRKCAVIRRVARQNRLAHQNTPKSRRSDAMT
ncbi:NUMOD4 motif-containing HNH endonuclease [Tsukamurella sp. NPDC003166]|uniref:NUMOD4 motif-containing HNH endonuclease n=1 Tax=Tsukamurella sp. NPDC003166 TaxID=3154444 RepID=UPI0033AB85AB